MRVARLSAAILLLAMAFVRAASAEEATIESLWKDACLWEVGSNTEKVPAARQALIAKGSPVLGFVIPEKLDTKDTLVTRALSVVLVGLGKPSVEPLTKALQDARANVRRNAADLLGQLKATEAGPAIAKLLGDKDTQMGALAALGSLQSRDTVPDIAALLAAGSSERVRVTSAMTLGQIGGPDATLALSRALSDGVAPVRFAAQYALEQIKAVPLLRSRLADRELRVRLHCIAALGHVGDKAARSDLVKLLDNPSPLVRGFAAEALSTMKAPGDDALLTRHLSTERDPFTRGRMELALAAKGKTSMTTPKILAFAGATREGSFNRKLIRIVADGAREAGAEVTLIELRDYPLPIFDGDLETSQGLPPNGRKLKDLFLSHGGLLLSCPEYNSSITGVLKNAIDWVSRPAPGEAPNGCFTDKVVGLTSASPGALGGLRGLITVRSILGNIGAIVLPGQVAVGRADAAFTPEGDLSDAKQRAAVRRVGAKVAETLVKLGG